MSKSSAQKFALSVTRAIGSPTSIVIHSAVFIGSFFAAYLNYIEWPTMLLVLTTIVSLEAIYLSIFIQMTINYTTQELAEVAEDIEEVQEYIGEIQEDIEEVQEDVEDLSEDVEEMTEEENAEEAEEEVRKSEQKKALGAIQSDLQRLLADIERLKSSHGSGNT